MQRVTITVDDELIGDLNRFIARRGYTTRSEAVRDLVRAAIQAAAVDMGGGPRRCIGAVIYVYDHSAHQLRQRLIEVSRARPGLSRTTLHVDLDHGRCMEIMVLRGRTEEVRQLSDQVIAQRGVQHGHLVLMPMDFKSRAPARK